ncbi:molybdopterin cofactor-binding domain-containing protein [Paenalcaligenes sp. Me52]|uniref:xanthine dehydrogenase family protein molybdopterin-binding subunit n=1 Tax=Paenalcaligenes sp. Me52 TaxID=3392038 RepID=UPI003D2AA5DC
MLEHSPKLLQKNLFENNDSLLILRAPSLPPQPVAGQPGVVSTYLQAHDDIFVAITAAQIYAFNGHVDLGTGIQTALGQIVADELDIQPEQLRMVLGHTEASPNQGPTIASASIQISAIPLRKAAAQAKQLLLQHQAEKWQTEAHLLHVKNGLINGPNGLQISYHDAVKGTQLRAYLDLDTQTKPRELLTIVGTSTPRVDIPKKAVGQFTYVHDVEVPGMWHARVVRPPYAGRDSGDFIGRSLESIDASSIQHISPDVLIVQEGDFVAVVAQREEHAIQAARELKVQWRTIPPLPSLHDLGAAIKAHPHTPRLLKDNTDEHTAPHPAGSITLQNEYVWPFQLHASIGPSCAVAHYTPQRSRLWSGTQNPHMLRTQLSELFELEEGSIEIIRHEASGCYGRNCADDVCADALLISKLTNRPIRVQLSREQEHAWEPKGAAQLMLNTASVSPEGELLHYDFATHYPSNDSPLLAALLIGKLAANPRTLQMGDRTAVPPYQYLSQRIVCNDTPPIVRASWLRGVSALPNSFAHECMIDELATAVAHDQVAFRIMHLHNDSRAQELLTAIAEKAQWVPHQQGSRGKADSDGWMHGRGVGYARYIHSRFPGFGAAWAAWILDLKVHAQSGKIIIKHIVVGQDTGQMVNPAGVRHQLHGNVIQSLSRSLYESVQFNAQGSTTLEWGAYPILKFTDLPPIDIILMDRQNEDPLGAGESGSLPCAPAIANALFDATNIRFYEAPFTPQRVSQRLQSSLTNSRGANTQ